MFKHLDAKEVKFSIRMKELVCNVIHPNHIIVWHKGANVR